jgi:hypothetical protein
MVPSAVPPVVPPEKKEGKADAGRAARAADVGLQKANSPAVSTSDCGEAETASRTGIAAGASYSPLVLPRLSLRPRSEAMDRQVKQVAHSIAPDV